MWNLKRNDTNKLTKQKETHRLNKNKLTVVGGRMREGIVTECGINRYTLLYLK